MHADNEQAVCAIWRLRKKLEQRDQKAAGMARKIAALESKLAQQSLSIDRFPEDLRRVVQDVLCNVRMIPVLHGLSTDRIVEVNMTAAPKRGFTGHDDPSSLVRKPRCMKCGHINHDGPCVNVAPC